MADTCATSEDRPRRQGMPCTDAKAARRWLRELPRFTGKHIMGLAACGRGKLRISARRAHHTLLGNAGSHR